MKPEISTTIMNTARGLLVHWLVICVTTLLSLPRAASLVCYSGYSSPLFAGTVEADECVKYCYKCSADDGACTAGTVKAMYTAVNEDTKTYLLGVSMRFNSCNTDLCNAWDPNYCDGVSSPITSPLSPVSLVCYAGYSSPLNAGSVDADHSCVKYCFKCTADDGACTPQEQKDGIVKAMYTAANEQTYAYLLSDAPRVTYCNNDLCNAWDPNYCDGVSSPVSSSTLTKSFTYRYFDNPTCEGEAKTTISGQSSEIPSWYIPETSGKSSLNIDECKGRLCITDPTGKETCTTNEFSYEKFCRQTADNKFSFNVKECVEKSTSSGASTRSARSSLIDTTIFTIVALVFRIM